MIPIAVASELAAGIARLSANTETCRLPCSRSIPSAGKPRIDACTTPVVSIIDQGAQAARPG